MLGGGLACFWWGVNYGVADDARIGCGWEVLCRTWLVVCCSVEFLALWVSHIRSRILQIQSDMQTKKIPFHAIWGLCWY